MATAKTSDEVVVFNIEPYLLPGSIFLSGLMISLSIFFSFNGVDLNLGSSRGRGGNEDVNEDELDPISQLVVDTDVNLEEFTQCFENTDFTDEIQADTTDGQDAGITGTPGFIIGTLDGNKVSGAIVSGAQPYSAFEDAIEAQLDGTGETGVKVNLDDDPVLGDLDSAKVAIVEFSDFECPFCQRFHVDTLDQIKDKYVDSGDVVYVYRDFPLSFHEPKASEAATAANCVREVAGDEAYYEFSKLYFEKTRSNGQGLPS